MSQIRYKVRLTGLKTPEGSIPLRALRELSGALLAAAERTLRLAIEGTSTKSGTRPNWLEAAVDFTFANMTSGSTTLEIDASTLGATIPARVLQQKMFYDLPSPDETALSVMLKSAGDATEEHLESDRFDNGVLKSIAFMEPLLKSFASSIEISSSDRPGEGLVLTGEKIATVKRISAQTPEPSMVVLAGILNTIEHREGAFKLLLSDGTQIPGEVDIGSVDPEELRKFWGKKVTVKAMAEFRPSGKARFLGLRLIKPFERGEELLEKAPSKASPLRVVDKAKRLPAAEGPLEKIWGQWPGDESIEELLSALGERPEREP